MKFQDSIEYQLLPIPFMVLTLCGTWCPENWAKNRKRIYKCVTTVLVCLGIILLVEMLVFIIIKSGKDNIDLENIFATICIAVGLYKKINILYHRPKLMNFISNYTKNEWNKPKNFEEATIHLNILSETRYISYAYAAFILVSIFFRSITPILESGTFIILPLDACYPYNADNFIAFSLTYLHQIISGVTLTCMHIGTDTLFVGLLLQMNYQLHVLKYRLRRLGNSKTYKNNTQTIKDRELFMKATISQRVREHESIFRFGYDLQKTFKPILMAQMVVVVPSVIINVYFLSIYTDRLNLKYFMTFFFALVSLMQIYMFCWYGNEILLSVSKFYLEC
ncbi:hypothetical protein TSAR_001224 [Trichomalopsis sarcophagae]|uniref:Odorant receptor n=1 Tax=Trichomalopsis sarcophagae TaxID=543379 RepID=A0A232F496_9HYME|nr:hypothetical protein TSAR_001224 [Trichomalopsis sarcophagae]